MLTILTALVGIYCTVVCFLAGQHFTAFCVGGLVVMQLAKAYGTVRRG